MKRKLSAAVFVAVAAMLAFAASAGAVDGTIEINQAKVMAAGGFPYKINQTGTYRLTGPLTLSGNGDAIEVTVNHVAIDLNGFAITVSSPSSSGSGINANVAELRVENGTITNFGGGDGILAGAQAIIRNVQADANADGIFTGNNSVIQGCTAVANSSLGVGIEAGNNSVISGNTANSNTNGIQCNGNGCQISGNTANSNSSTGIVCDGNGCQISGNTANSNSGSNGIVCDGSGCLISGNTIDNNLLSGILANDATTGYGGNVLDGNDTNVNGGTSLGAGNTNLCGTTRC